MQWCRTVQHEAIATWDGRAGDLWCESPMPLLCAPWGRRGCRRSRGSCLGPTFCRHARSTQNPRSYINKYAIFYIICQVIILHRSYVIYHKLYVISHTTYVICQKSYTITCIKINLKIRPIIPNLCKWWLLPDQPELHRGHLQLHTILVEHEV